MVTLKADDRRRVQIPDAKPGQVFSYEVSGEVVTLTPLKPVDDETPLVKLVRRSDGSYRFPDNARPSREAIRVAIRADRDAR